MSKGVSIFYLLLWLFYIMYFKIFIIFILYNFRILGFEKLISHVLTEWTMNIKENCIPTILQGIGPMHFIVGFGKCFETIYKYTGHSTPNRTVWKILILDLHFLTFFSTHQKTLPGKFWIFLFTSLKDIEFPFFTHNFFKNGPNSKFLFF